MGKLENMLTTKPCDKLEKMLISTPLKTQKTEQEYEKSDPEMKTEPMDLDYEIDSGINSDYDSTDSEREKENWSNETKYNIVKECAHGNREVDKSLESNETILENNRKLIQALEIEMAKYKQFRSKFNSAQQELQTVEITVKELAAIECQLRESLRDREEQIRREQLEIDNLEEENANLRETIGRFRKIRWKEEKIKSQEEINSEKEVVDQKYIKLEKELEDQKLKYRNREEELENSLEITKQQIEKWEENKVNDMVNMAFNLSGITVKGVEPVMNCLVDKVNQKQIIINNQTQEIEDLKRDSSEKLGKTQRYIDHMKRERERDLEE